MFCPPWPLIRVQLIFFPTLAWSASLWLQPPLPAYHFCFWVWLFIHIWLLSSTKVNPITWEARGEANRHMWFQDHWAHWSPIRTSFLKVDTMFIFYYLGKKGNSKCFWNIQQTPMLALKVKSTKCHRSRLAQFSFFFFWSKGSFELNPVVLVSDNFSDSIWNHGHFPMKGLEQSCSKDGPQIEASPWQDMYRNCGRCPLLARLGDSQTLLLRVQNGLDTLEIGQCLLIKLRHFVPLP